MSRTPFSPSLPEWDTLATLDDEALPLMGTALLVARDEYPDLDPSEYEARVHEHVSALRPAVAAMTDDAARIACINRYLFGELGYSGNHDAYDDPRNSYLNDVLDRRLGIPLSLAIVQMEVARRLDVRLEGVSFPGHFLVRMPLEGGIVVMDPFNGGRPLGTDELKARVAGHMAGETPDDRQLMRLLEPASHRSILVRMLRNLSGLYRNAEDWARTARVYDRILCIDPGARDALKDRGLAYLSLGHMAGARADLSRFMSLTAAEEVEPALRELLVEVSGRRWSMH